MLFKTAINTLLAMSMAGTAMAEEATPNAPAAGGTLPISYGKCYRIQTQDRQWMAKRSSGYQGWDFELKNSGVYKVCQRGIDQSCEYDSVRPVSGEEDFFLWAFQGSNLGGPNLLASNNPGWRNWFYASYGGYREYIFHFRGTTDCEQGTTPCGIQTGGHNGHLTKGIAGEEIKWPLAVADEDSTVLLWFHEWECPEEKENSS